MHVQPYDSHAYLQAFNSRSWEPAGNTTLTDPRSQRNQVGRRGRPDNNTSSQLIRYPGLPTERAPDAPVPVAQGYSQQPEISQATGGVDGVMPDSNLVDVDGAIASRQFDHHPPPHHALSGLPASGPSFTTPRFWTVSQALCRLSLRLLRFGQHGGSPYEAWIGGQGTEP